MTYHTSKRMKFEAKVVKFGTTRDIYEDPTLELKEIYKLKGNDREKVKFKNKTNQHCWSVIGKRIGQANLHTGDRISFEARFKDYMHDNLNTNKRNADKISNKLAWISNIHKINK